MKTILTARLFKWLITVSLFGLAGCQSLSPDPDATSSPAQDDVVVDETRSPVQACECPVQENESCPQLVPAVVEDGKEKNFIIDDMLLVGRVEYVQILPEDLKLKAKVDTGAKTSSLHAEDLTSFERDGKAWVRFSMHDPKADKSVYFERPVIRKTKVKQQQTDLQLRPTVSMSVRFGPITEQVDFTLADRTGYLYQVLIGRNFLRDRAIVDVSRTFMTSSTE